MGRIARHGLRQVDQRAGMAGIGARPALRLRDGRGGGIQKSRGQRQHGASCDGAGMGATRIATPVHPPVHGRRPLLRSPASGGMVSSPSPPVPSGRPSCPGTSFHESYARTGRAVEVARPCPPRRRAAQHDSDPVERAALGARAAALQLKATDLDLEIVESSPAEIGMAGSTTVPAHTLYDIVRKAARRRAGLARRRRRGDAAPGALGPLALHPADPAALRLSRISPPASFRIASSSRAPICAS